MEEQIMNTEVTENKNAEVAAYTAKPAVNVGVVAGVAFTAGALAYKYIVSPVRNKFSAMIAKRKAAKEAKNETEESDED